MQTTLLLFVTFALALPSLIAAQNPCRAAFRMCRFRFAEQGGLRTFSVTGPADQAFTSDIILKNRKQHVGVLNSNIEAEFIGSAGEVTQVSQAIPPPAQAYSPHVFKPYFPSTSGMFSGIGHETFQGQAQLDFAKGKCVRVFFTNWQILNNEKQVVDNFNSNERDTTNCIVFRTRNV